MYIIIILFAVLIEAVIQFLKPIWGDKMLGKLTLTELISMVLGIVIAVLAKLNIAEAIAVTQPALLYIMYVFTGLIMGRGASVVHDLWAKLNTYSTK